MKGPPCIYIKKKARHINVVVKLVSMLLEVSCQCEEIRPMMIAMILNPVATIVIARYGQSFSTI
jgi:hypothetical protein